MKDNIQIRTLTQDDVRRLALSRRNKKWAVSFYLGIRGDRDFRSVANSAISEEEKRIKGEGIFSNAEYARIHQSFAEIQAVLSSRRLPDRTRTLVFFFSDRGAPKMFKLPVYVPTRIVMEKDFYVHPSIKSLDKYPRYAVVCLQRDRASIFDFFWGESEGSPVEVKSEVPQRMNAARATWRGLEERKIQNHIEVHIDRHLGKVAGAVEKFMDGRKVPYLVIGSRKELIERFRGFLPKRLQKKIVGSYLVQSNPSIKRIRDRSLQVIGDFENAQEEGLSEMFLAEADKKAKGAVVGTENVLGYLYDYQIRTLVIARDYLQEGYVCEGKHHPFFRRGLCPVCGSPAAVVGDIADEIIEEAIRQKVRIIHFENEHPGFDRFGIGAILK